MIIDGIPPAIQIGIAVLVCVRYPRTLVAGLLFINFESWPVGWRQWLIFLATILIGLLWDVVQRKVLKERAECAENEARQLEKEIREREKNRPR